MSKIDDIFKNNLNNNGLPYEDSYWEDMEAILEEKKKRKPVFFLQKKYLLIFSLFVTIATLFTLYHLNYSTPNKSQPTVSENQGNKTIGIEKTISESESDKIEKASSNKELPELKLANKKNITSLNKNETIGRNSILEKRSKEEIKQSQGLSQESTSEAEKIYKPTFSILTLLESKPHKLENYYNIFVAPLPPSPDLNAKGLRIKIFTSNPWEFYISASYEFDKYSRSTNSSSLKADERTLDKGGYNFNFLVKKDNWGFKTGFGIMQLTEETNYIIENKNYDYKTSYKMVNAHYSQTPAGTPIAIIKKQVDSTVTVTKNILNPNGIAQFTYLKIPLAASYEITLQRFRFYADLGITTAILLKQKGDYTTFEGNKFIIQSDNKSNDFSKVVFQSYTAIGLKYQVMGAFNIYGGIGYSKSLNSMVKSYDQKPVLKFITAGIEVKL